MDSLFWWGFFGWFGCQDSNLRPLIILLSNDDVIGINLESGVTGKKLNEDKNLLMVVG